MRSAHLAMIMTMARDDVRPRELRGGSMAPRPSSASNRDALGVDAVSAAARKTSRRPSVAGTGFRQPRWEQRGCWGMVREVMTCAPVMERWPSEIACHISITTTASASSARGHRWCAMELAARVQRGVGQRRRWSERPAWSASARARVIPSCVLLGTICLRGQS